MPDYPNSFSFSPNHGKQVNSRQPDYIGNIRVDDTEWQLALWKRIGKRGTYLSGSSSLDWNLTGYITVYRNYRHVEGDELPEYIGHYKRIVGDAELEYALTGYIYKGENGSNYYGGKIRLKDPEQKQQAKAEEKVSAPEPQKKPAVKKYNLKKPPDIMPF
jgi:hypothetical protein